MDLRDRARQLAQTGEYADARAVIFTLFKLGYARAPGTFGVLDRLRLDRICRASVRKKRHAG